MTIHHTKALFNEEIDTFTTSLAEDIKALELILEQKRTAQTILLKVSKVLEISLTELKEVVGELQSNPETIEILKTTANTLFYKEELKNGHSNNSSRTNHLAS